MLTLWYRRLRQCLRQCRLLHSTPVVTVPQSFVQSVPTFIVKQPQMPKPYSGLTSYQSFKEHFERICRVNAWTSTEDKVQNLTLALEGPAAEILKDVNESSPTAYDEIWTLLAQRFGQTDAPRDAMRRFDNRRQTDNESIPMHRPFVCFIEKLGLLLPQAREILT